jgi:NTE family protein
MGDYTSASFDAANDIIELGIAEGRKYYPFFKHLADSLKSIYPDYVFTKNRLPIKTAYKFSKIEVEGLNKKAKEAFFEQISIDTGIYINARKLEKEGREAFAYRMYKSIVSEVNIDDKGDYTLLYRVKPESPVILKAGLSQNTFTGFAVNLNLTARHLLTPFSRSLVSASFGQNFRAMAEHQQMFGYNRPLSYRLQAYVEFQELPTYTDFRRTGLYKLKYVTIDNRFQLSAKRRSAGGMGIQWDNINALPEVESGTYLRGKNNFFHAYAFWQFNNLSKPQYPKKGTQIELKAGYVFSVNPDFQVYEDGVLVGGITKDIIQYGSYARTTASFFNITPMSTRWAWVNRVQGGINFSGNQSLLNIFIAGGMNPTMHNQVLFAGLKEGEVISESMAAAQTGVRYNPFGKVYATLLGNVMAYDFIRKDSLQTSSKWIMGTGLTVAYDLPIGPIELTLMMTNKSGGLRSYFNFGFPFRL